MYIYNDPQWDVFFTRDEAIALHLPTTDMMCLHMFLFCLLDEQLG